MKACNLITTLAAFAALVFYHGAFADASAVSCDFTADKTEAVLSSESGSVEITFTATFNGEHEGTLSYVWDFGDGYEQSVTTPTAVKRYTSCGKDGWYSVTLTVKDLSSKTLATVVKTRYICIAPEHVYVSPSSTGGIYPYNLKTKAAPDLFTALQAATSGTKVHLAKGTYDYVPNGANMPVVAAGVTVIGETDDPADTVISCPSSCSQSNGMLLLVKHPNALVANITFEGGRNESNSEMAAGLRIDEGVVSNCVVRKCFVTGSAPHAGVWVRNGLLTHSIIEENTVTIQDAENGYAANGNQRRETGAFVDGSGRIENCLFRNLKSDGCLIVLSDAKAAVRNCTVVDCEVSFWTENPQTPSSTPTLANPRKQFPAYAIEDVADCGATVLNTVIFNVKRRAFHDIGRSKDWTEDTNVPFTHKSQWIDDPGSFIPDPGYCTNCASEVRIGVDKKTTCKTMTKLDFVNYDGGDLVPCVKGALFDAGRSISGFENLVDLSGQSRVVGDGLDIGCYEQQETGKIIKDVYVDSNFSGTSYGTITAPFKTIREACNKVTSTGMRIFVRGGPDRAYPMANCNDAALLSKESTQLIGCDANWKPAEGYKDPTNRMVNLVLAENYAVQSASITGKNVIDAPIKISASKCLVSGIRCEFGNKSFKESNVGTSLIRVDTTSATVSDTTIENCWFKMKEAESALNCAGTEGIVSAAKVTKSTDKRCDNCVIRRCYAWMGKYGATVNIFSNLHNGTRVEQCFFENLDTLFTGEHGVRLTGNEYSVISNIFLNCANDYGTKDKSWLLDTGGDYAPYGGEVAYNLAIHDNGDGRLYRFMQHGREGTSSGSWQGTVNVHHNTIVGYDIAIESPKPSGTVKYGTAWKPYIFDNLIVSVGSMFSEDATARWKVSTTTLPSSFKSGSTFYNNALLCGNFVIGTATELSGYDIYKNLKGSTDTTIYLDSTPPIFINTTDPMDENYYRMKVPLNPWVVNAYTESGAYPAYIGAVKPQAGGFAVRIR